MILLGVVGACDDGMPPPQGSLDAVIFGTVETEDATPVEDRKSVV